MKRIVKHEETNMFLLNVHSLHNYDLISKVIPLDLRPALTVPLVATGDSKQVRLNAANHIRQKKAGETIIVSAGAECQPTPAFDRSTGQAGKRKGVARTRKKAPTAASALAEPPPFASVSAAAASGTHVVSAASPAIQPPQPLQFNSTATSGPIFQSLQPPQFHAYSQAPNPYQAGTFTAPLPYQIQSFQPPAHPYHPVGMGIPPSYHYYPGAGVQFNQFQPPGPAQHLGSSGNFLFNNDRHRDSVGDESRAASSTYYFVNQNNP